MRELPWKRWRERWRETGGKFAQKYRYVLLVILVGIVLLLWPAGGKTAAPEAPPDIPATTGEEEFSVAALEKKMSQTLSRVRGAGDVTVMLTVQGGPRRVLATDEKSSRSSDGGGESLRTTVVVSGASGAGDDPVLIQQLYPRFQGALVVYSGSGDAQVRLELMEAVSDLTGLGTDKITICKGKG